MKEFKVGNFVIINNYWHKNKKVQIAELISGIREGRKWFRFYEEGRYMSDGYPLEIIQNIIND